MGKKVFGYGDFFCWNCGKRIEKGVDNCPYCSALYGGNQKYGNVLALGAGGIGWSDKARHPSFKKYFKNQRKAGFIWLIGISIIVPGGLLISKQISLDSEGIFVITGLLGIFWVVGLLFMFMGKKNKPDWDGVVENKRFENKVRKKRDDDGTSYKVSYTEYIVVIRKQNGSIYELKWEDNPAKYEYYRNGDYVHYHGSKYMNYFEKYDKSLDPFLFCVACGDKRDARDNYCGRCGAVLLKGDRQS